MRTTYTIFVIISGESAIFSLNDGTSVKSRAYCASADHYAKSNAPELFSKYPNARISILLDTPDQNFTHQQMPGVSSMSISKLVNKRLARDYPEDDFKGAICCGREKTGRKDWRYLYVHAPKTPEIEVWLKYFEKLSNPFVGIFLLPLEARCMIQSLNKVLEKDRKSKNQKSKEKIKDVTEDKPSDVWTFLSLTQKSGGIRQVVLKGENVYFTRFVRFPQNAVPDVIAGVIEQEIVNTIDYLRRLSFHENDAARAIIIASNEIKAAIGAKDIAGMKSIAFSPYEFSVKIGMSGACRLDDKYADILSAVTFATRKPTLRIFTPTLKTHNSAHKTNTFLKVAAACMTPVFLGVAGYLSWSAYSLKDDISRLESKKVTLNRQMREENEVSEEIDQEKAAKIISAISVWKELKETVRSSPQKMLKHLAIMSHESIKIKNIRWSYVPAEQRGRGQTSERESAQISIDFYNKDKSPESLFSSFELFSRNMNEEFSDYNIQYSRLPDRLTFESETNIVPVNITIAQRDEDER